MFAIIYGNMNFGFGVTGPFYNRADATVHMVDHFSSCAAWVVPIELPEPSFCPDCGTFMEPDPVEVPPAPKAKAKAKRKPAKKKA